MKKNRYSKPVRKEVPSRRKLEIEAQRLQVVAEQRAHELRYTREDLETVRDERRTWRGRAESMREENERLRKQVDGLAAPKRFLHVTARPGPKEREEMMYSRHWQVEMPRYHVGVDVSVERFQTMARGDGGVFAEALADQLAREVKRVVMENLRIQR